MPYVFDPAAIIDSLGPTTIGEQFEKDRMDVGEDLRDLVESRPYYEAYHDKSESRDLIKVTAEPLEWVAAIFEESQDCLRFKLGEMKTLLLQIQYANWPYRQFPYVPKCLLYICAFALAHSLVADGNPISKIVWRTTENAALYPNNPRFCRAFLLGLRVSVLWSFTRACKMGIIIWCRFSLHALIKKFEADQLGKRDVDTMQGFQWRMLWFINIMLS
ncbi:uncharacterized protein EAE98_012011 [Botrytis deweyae]|uniref:Transcription factor domain-containing protein n=1 Tax=Botrytis deweyae TaxID=2478750 RepID=A0ABQ7I4D3_9HELO|nr:uncharacterized protein EAE98_012011 [Botrytis deweyae]KAF7911541.1 hypothetical protein EAE98_012011 [Botrytis deweyae]